MDTLLYRISTFIAWPLAIDNKSYYVFSQSVPNLVRTQDSCDLKGLQSYMPGPSNYFSLVMNTYIFEATKNNRG